LQQAVGESSGRRTGVEGTKPRHHDPKTPESSFELLASPADEARPLSEELDRIAGKNEAGRLVRRSARDRHAPAGDLVLSSLPARGEAPAHQLGVEAAARS
jgi:hypothetical protein